MKETTVRTIAEDATVGKDKAVAEWEFVKRGGHVLKAIGCVFEIVALGGTATGWISKEACAKVGGSGLVILSVGFAPDLFEYFEKNAPEITESLFNGIRKAVFPV